jgi:predicted DNA-binding protein YlxM (UPF0122 family)
MLKYLKEAQSKKKQSGQWQNGILTVEDKLLLTLQYYRENRSMFHIGIDFDINKSSVVRIIHWVENILNNCNEFKLPGKKQLLANNMEYEVFVVDATETPIERPINKSKKNEKIYKNTSIQVKRKNTP